MICRQLVKVGTGAAAYYDVSRYFLTGDDAVIQAIRCELFFQLGEWFLDTSKGLPWLRNANSTQKQILGTFPADLDYARAFLRAAILGVAGVHSLTSMVLDHNHATRGLACVIAGVLESGATFTITEAVL